MKSKKIIWKTQHPCCQDAMNTKFAIWFKMIIFFRDSHKIFIPLSQYRNSHSIGNQGEYLILAFKMTRKSRRFSLVNYKWIDVRRHFRFFSRHYMNLGATTSVKSQKKDEEVVSFIGKIQHSNKAFQRGLIRRKVIDILNFYETAQIQPIIRGSLRLYMSEVIHFGPFKNDSSLGNLLEPTNHFIIIDGQHRSAGPPLFNKHYPEEAESVKIPAIVFDGKQENFAAEIFVIINSTHSRINKSHLIERFTYGISSKKKWAAWIVSYFYKKSRSPLKYKINKLGGRSRQDKWILQSELFNEVFKLVNSQWMDDATKKLHRYFSSEFGWNRREKITDIFIGYFRVIKSIIDDVRGNNKKVMFFTAVTIKALATVLRDLLVVDEIKKEWRSNPGQNVFTHRIYRWNDMIPDFRPEGFYERFAAKGQVERVRIIRKELMKRMVMG